MNGPVSDDQNIKMDSEVHRKPRRKKVWMSYGQSVDDLQREVKSELQESRRDETEAHMILQLDVFVSIHGLIKSYNQYC